MSKYLQISLLWAETCSLANLFNSITFKIVYSNSLYQLFWSAHNLHLFLTTAHNLHLFYINYHIWPWSWFFSTNFWCHLTVFPNYLYIWIQSESSIQARAHQTSYSRYSLSSTGADLVHFHKPSAIFWAAKGSSAYFYRTFAQRIGGIWLVFSCLEHVLYLTGNFIKFQKFSWSSETMNSSHFRIGHETRLIWQFVTRK